MPTLSPQLTVTDAERERGRRRPVIEAVTDRRAGLHGSVSLPITLTAWDFSFLPAGAVGLYAIRRLSLVQERGAIAPRKIRNIPGVAGLRATRATQM